MCRDHDEEGLRLNKISFYAAAAMKAVHLKATSPAHMVSSSMSFSSVLLVAVELPDVLLPSSGFTSSSVRQSTSRSPSDRS